jgi:nucleotide-binding universal stress UspA family protein
MAQERIVVGIDGSEPSKAALRWALAEARLRGAQLTPVLAWEFPSLALTSYGDATLPVGTMADVEKQAETVAHACVAEVMGDALDPPIDLVVRQGHPAAVLLQEAKGASLIVVGSRGRGGFSGAVLGSVSTNVVHHAECPVVVLRRPR